jgi:flagella basal body P-ring formation protein FlgA
MPAAALSPASSLSVLLRTVIGVALALLFGSSMLRAQAPVAQVPVPQATGAVDSAASASLARGLRRVTWPVSRRALATGDTVRAGDIALLDTTIVWRWSSAPDTTRAVAGWIARRPIAAGAVLRAPGTMAPSLVSAGATVSAIWQDGPLRLVLTGVATNSAPFGASVGVRIDRSRRLDGIAVAPNTVRLR